MTLKELNQLIESLQSDPKGNKELIEFYIKKRKEVIMSAIKKGMEGIPVEQ